ncbi:polysaccharide deacetylase family protein [Nesterenkonia salmonea]|uniref:polysaccharide deacetylase family protein n=1 Tax=Nesterenkonia salmonea TaxID=1804987 RepID=UPI00140AA3B5|nr:polysaccharide deacetylase family protein [Nesterenkonia salmonea]
MDTVEPLVSLTFDDGPHPEHTPGILDVLAERQARATFFVLASQAAENPDIVRRIAAEGHEVALHGLDHTALTRLSDAQALQNIRQAKDLVEGIAQTEVKLFRPPYGKHTWRQALGIRRMGMELAIWSGHAWDWIDDETVVVADRALQAVFPGAVLLLHDHRADPEMLGDGERLPTFNKAEVLSHILDGLSQRNFGTVTAHELLSNHRQVRSALRDRMRRE